MIEVTITTRAGQVELGKIRITNVSEPSDSELADYSVQFAIDRNGAVGIHQRPIRGFPRTKANVLGLLLAALLTLSEDELSLDSQDFSRTRNRKQLPRL